LPVPLELQPLEQQGQQGLALQEQLELQPLVPLALRQPLQEQQRLLLVRPALP
jgi:hypothetical protein